MINPLDMFAADMLSRTMARKLGSDYAVKLDDNGAVTVTANPRVNLATLARCIRDARPMNPIPFGIGRAEWFMVDGAIADVVSNVAAWLELNHPDFKSEAFILDCERR